MNISAQMDRRQLFRVATVASLASVGSLTLFPSYAAAAVDISHKIKIAGDLRMFTQRMALSTAFVMLGEKPDYYLNVLREEYDEFEADIAALRAGDPKYAMAAEENKLVLEAINTVEIGWKILGPALKDVIDAGAVDDAHFKKIEHVNSQVMTLADSLIHRIMFEYKDDLPVELAYQIDVVGYQRTLSQKMIKEAILVALEYEAEAHHEMLLGSMQLFRFNLDKLAGKMLHNEKMLPEPSAAIAEQLAKAEHCWAKLQPILEKLDNAHEVSKDEVHELALEADRMLAAFDVMSDVLIKEAELV